MTAFERGGTACFLTVLLVLLVLALPSAAHAASGSSREYRVMVFTRAVGEQHASTAAGVKAIKDLGKERASASRRPRPDGVPRGPSQAGTRGRLPRHLGRRPHRRAAGRLRGLLPRRRRLRRHRLGDRDRARLAVPHRRPRHAVDRRRLGRAVGDDQGRRPRPRRVEEPAGVLEPHRRLVQLHGERPRRLARPRHGRRGSVRPQPQGQVRRHRRRHDGRRPPGRLVQGLQGRPLVLHRPRQHRRRASATPTFRSAPRRRDRLGGRRGRPRLQRLRRDRARELPADQDQRRRRTSASRSASTSSPTGGSSRPTAAAACACTTRRRATPTAVIADACPVYTNSEDGLYGPAVDNDFATNHWVYLYYAPPIVTDITYSDGTTGHTNDSDGAAPERRARPGRRHQRLGPWIGYFQLSRFKFVDDAPGAPAHLDLASEQQILRVPNNRGACCHVAGDIDFDKHNNLWFVTGDDSAAGSGDAGGLGQSIDQKTDENQTVRVNERDRRHVHADVQRADDRPDRRSTPRPRRSRRRWRRSATSAPATSRPPAAR